jgi:acyl-CoA reductase-like NAD-dependent aldehyde dehydrogenase
MSLSLKVTNPFNGQLIREIPFMDSKQVENALASSNGLFQNRSRWIPKYERIKILENTISLMKDRAEELTKIATEEGGKPYEDSKVEVLRATKGIKIAIEHIGQLKGEEIPMGITKTSVNRIAYTMREPIGVVTSISAFNHPLNLIIHQTIPAIAVGAPVNIKPALTTPLSCLNFVNILYEAGLPKEWCKPIICERELSEKLVTDKRVSYLSFIGSPGVGWYLRSKLSQGTRCALEHGGAAPVIVEPDADLSDALDLLSKGGFYHAGQVCVSVQRVYVHESIINEFKERFTKITEKLIVGNPLDPKTEVGPLILPSEVDRVNKWVNETREKGGEILCGGKKLSESCYSPTVILNPPDDDRVSTQEIFGPVVCLYTYSDRMEAIKRANSLPFAFQAAVFTHNLDIALDTVNRLNATAVMVNDHTAFRVDWMPFGGRDSSGIGMGGIPYSMHEMTREKMIVIKSKVIQ